jgi:hypothetical protein
MARLSDLVTTVAESTGLAESAVKEVARRLREGKLIQTGPVGRYGGAQMTPDDAAALIVGLMVSRAADSSMKNLASVTRELLSGISYKRGRQWRPGGWPHEVNLPFLSRLGSGHSLKDAVVALIEWASSGDSNIDPDQTVLAVHYAPTHPHAIIRFNVEVSGLSGRYATTIELAYARVRFPITIPSLTVNAELMFATFQDIGRLLEPQGQG